MYIPTEDFLDYCLMLIHDIADLTGCCTEEVRALFLEALEDTLGGAE